jgi:hypothetical protein
VWSTVSASVSIISADTLDDLVDALLIFRTLPVNEPNSFGIHRHVLTCQRQQNGGRKRKE